MNIVRQFAERAYANPYLLLTLATLFFGGNTVAGRLAIDNITPYQVVFLRWLAVTLMLGVLLRRRIPDAWRQCRPRWRWVALMGMTGFTAFNTLFYIAAHKTSAINLGIIQGTIPAWVLMGAFLLHRTATGVVQIIGVLITVSGVLLLSTRGDLSQLIALTDMNHGDAMMFIACLIYAAYTIGLKNRPRIDGLCFFFFLAVAAMLSSLPLTLYEWGQGESPPPTAQGWLVLAYIALFPSCLSHIFYIRGVEILGPGRAGVFINLVPVFAALCAVLLINEKMQWYQGVALILVIGGIGLSERGSRRAARAL